VAGIKPHSTTAPPAPCCAFAVTDDHARQEQVYDGLSWNREPSTIRRAMTERHVPARDRRALFVGIETYEAAGGHVLRDLFAEDGGGYLEDAALLDRLAMEKLAGIAAGVQAAEGWKWVQACMDYPHAHGLARRYLQPVELSPEDRDRLDAARAEFDTLAEEYDGIEDLPEAVEARLGDLEAEIARLEEARRAYAADTLARGGAFVILDHDGTARIERGFVRPGDEPRAEPDTAEAPGAGDSGDDGSGNDGNGGRQVEPADDDGEDARPLSDLLVRDLTAHRTLGLRLALGERPEVALAAVAHALAVQAFYRAGEATCLDIRPTSAPLGGHAEGIAGTAAAQALAARHEAWALRLPQEVADLWSFVAGLPHEDRMALLAHCAALTVFAVRQPWERSPHIPQAADRLAQAVGLDMTAHWQPTARSYLGRVAKARIVAAVREGVSEEAARRIAGMKKQPMAEAAEQLLAGTGWLPALLRTPATADTQAGQPLAEAAA